MGEDRASYDIAIVGLGPVGAALGCLLGRAGVRVLALERNRTVYPLPRAAHVDGEIVRIFQGLGLVAHIAPHIRPAPPYEFLNASGGVLMQVPAAEFGPDGWFTHYTIYQPGLELALRAMLEALPNVDVRLGATFQSFNDQDDQVTLSYSTDGGEAHADARLLIACDGGSSPVREAAGIGLDNYGFDEPWLVVDALVADAAPLPANCTQYCYPSRPVTCTPLGPGRHRWEFMVLPDDDAARMTDPENINRLLEPWGGSTNLTIERTAVYHFHGLVAERWRSGRVLLAGDAAHQMPPFAGQGMCSGIRDAENMAWKIARVLDGAPMTLLDSIQPEREPQVRGITEMAIAAGRLVCTIDPQVAEARDRDALSRAERGEGPPSFPIPTLGRSGLLRTDPVSGTIFPQFVSSDRRRSDTVLGDGPWLICQRRSAGADDSVSAFGTGDERLSPFEPAFTQWLEEQGASAVLVRPDRVIFGVGDAEALLADWNAALGRKS